MKSQTIHNDLIENFRNGSENALKEIYESNFSSLCYFADQLIKNSAEAEDIVVETFLKLLKKKTDFENYAEIKAFLFRVIRNACFDYLRKARLVDKSKIEISYLAKPDEDFGEHEMIAAKVLQAIYQEIEQLPAQCKIIFKSIFIDNKSTGTIAEEMGLSPQTILNQKTKALQILRHKLYKSGIVSAATFLYWMSLLSKHSC